MIIDQLPTTPDRIPYALADVPILWVDNGDATALSAFVGALRTAYLTIPAVIRAELEKPYTRTSGSVVVWDIAIGSYDFVVDQWASGYGRNPGDVAWAGLYHGPDAGDLETRISTALRWDQAGGWAIVHEFGHHLDAMYNSLWPAGSGTNQRLTATAPFYNLWDTVSPNIPSALYGGTNIFEWFAELWKCQLDGNETMFFQLVGFSDSARTAARALFTSRLPMPPFGGL